MICQRCRSSILSRFHQHHSLAWSASSAARQLPLQRTQFRNYSDGAAPATPSSPPKPRQPAPGNATAPSAISSASPGVSQPLSTPGEAHTDAAPGKSSKPATDRPLSSCPAGMKMTGLNFFKNKPEAVALDDSEYPDWLWGLLPNAKDQQTATSSKVDLSMLNKKQRKRYERKRAARESFLPPQIPVHHQATDVTPAQYNQRDQGGDVLAQATEGLEKRTEITKSAREARRRSIRESNFLKGL